ncbi:MAG: glycosyltransferase family 9 protein [bacterium]|nr:glycosyltransferase family 9 protein [bacterium]
MLFGERCRFIFYATLGMVLSPVLFFVGFLRRARMRAPREARILVIPIMTRVGDLVCATPVFRALKLQYPHCRLSVLVAKNAAGIVRHNPRIDELIVMNDAPFKGFWGRGRFFLFLYQQKFDYAIALANNPFGSLAALWSAAPVRIKTVVRPRTLVEILTDWWNTRSVRYEHCSFLQAHYLRLLVPLRVPYALPVKEVFTTPEGEQKVKEFLRVKKFADAQLRIGITVTAGNRIKEWPPERFAELADRIVESGEARTIFIDSARNLQAVNEVVGMMKRGERAVAATEFSLEELPSLIKKLHMFIAVDTGLIYIAHALGVPLVDIIGPVEPNEQPPNDERSAQVLPPPKHTPSSFVIKRPGSAAARRAAVEAISVSAVYEAFEQLV